MNRRRPAGRRSFVTGFRVDPDDAGDGSVAPGPTMQTTTTNDTYSPDASGMERGDPESTIPTGGLRIGLPKGRMQAEVDRLLEDCGLEVDVDRRGYRPRIDGIEGIEAKRLKPQAILSMLATGTRDLGFAGADWVEEFEIGDEVVELLDTGLDRVRIVVAVPGDASIDRGGRVRIATEMPSIASRWACERGLDFSIVQSWGATEVLPPEDADAIVDIVQSGATLAANGLQVVETISLSSTRVYASRKAMACPDRRPTIDRLVDLLYSVLEARSRYLIDLNVSAQRLGRVIEILPCMREPTVSPLVGDGFAVRAAVPREGFPGLIAAIKAAGGTDLVVTEARQVIP